MVITHVPPTAHTAADTARPWRRRLGLGFSGLATLFFLLDASGKLLQIEAVIKATTELGWPTSSVLPLGLLLLAGTVLYAVPRTAVLGAIYLSGFLGGAIAAHYRIGSPLFSHVLFGAYLAALMWGGLVLRYPRLLALIVPPGAVQSAPIATSARRTSSTPSGDSAACGGSGSPTA